MVKPITVSEIDGIVRVLAKDLVPDLYIGEAQLCHNTDGINVSLWLSPPTVGGTHSLDDENAIHGVLHLTGHQLRRALCDKESFCLMIQKELHTKIEEMCGGSSEFYKMAYARWFTDVPRMAFRREWQELLIVLLDAMCELQDYLEKQGKLRKDLKLPEQVVEARRRLHRQEVEDRLAIPKQNVWSEAEIIEFLNGSGSRPPLGRTRFYRYRRVDTLQFGVFPWHAARNPLLWGWTGSDYAASYTAVAIWERQDVDWIQRIPVLPAPTEFRPDALPIIELDRIDIRTEEIYF